MPESRSRYIRWSALVADTDDGIDLQKLLCNLILITLRKAARHNNVLQTACLLLLNQREDLFNCFFLCCLNESAGIDDRDIRFFDVGSQRKACLLHPVQHSLGIHQIFGAPQRDHADVHKRLREYVIIVPLRDD